MPSRSTTTPWLALLFALMGLVWCGYVAFPTTHPAPCLTSGCELFRDTRFGGVSLWWVGGAYFFLLTVICLRGNRPLAAMLSSFALFMDALLLLIMFFTAPCFDCLVVAALLGMSYLVLRPAASGSGNKFQEDVRRSFLLPVWFGLFLGNAVLAAEEQAPPYIMGNAEATQVRVYFAPSCPACRAAIISLGHSAALYPVEEKEGDFEAVMRLSALLKNGMGMEEALLRSLNEEEALPDMSFFERMTLKIQLLRNKAAVWSQGFRALPLIVINGMPGGAPVPLEKGAGPGAQGRQGASPPTQGQAVMGAGGYAPTGGGAVPTGNGLEAGGALSGQDSGNGRGAHGPAPEFMPDFLNNADNLQQCGGANAAPCD
ncbi:hypothetical protein LJC59_04645 [Desulfovibrio sp. OttesenSCG-928-A18]|nr:hypothetical protein [Desulfovibrio sp. OttesenSCG-928-A18]